MRCTTPICVGTISTIAISSKRSSETPGRTLQNYPEKVGNPMIWVSTDGGLEHSIAHSGQKKPNPAVSLELLRESGLKGSQQIAALWRGVPWVRETRRTKHIPPSVPRSSQKDASSIIFLPFSSFIKGLT